MRTHHIAGNGLRGPAPAVALLLAPYAVMATWLCQHIGVAAMLAYVTLNLCLMALLAWTSRTWRQWLLLQLPVFLLAAVMTAYAVITQELPGDSIAYVLATSTWDEALGLFGLAGYRWLPILTVLALILYLWLALRPAARGRLPQDTRRYRWACYALLVSAAGSALSAPYQFMNGVAASPVLGSALFLGGPLRDARRQVRGDRFVKLPFGAVPVQTSEVHILVIGESSRRDSWQLYGYDRPTTPILNALRPELIVLQHAVGDANGTVFAVPMLLTGMNPSTYAPKAMHGNLVDLAKEAGYYTSWLVNQDAAISHLVGIQADYAVYPRSMTETTLRNLPPDGILLPQLRQQLSRGGGQFIGLHVDGSHWAYFDRYPPSFQRFGSAAGLGFSSLHSANGDQRMLDSYDNSILYTDWFLGQVIMAARQLRVPATVTYLSDHGESIFALDGTAGHGDHVPLTSQYRIPAFIWTNEAYLLAHPDKIAALRANADRLIRSHDFFYTLADLLGIRWPGARGQRSFASPQFQPDTGPYIVNGHLMSWTAGAP